MSKLAEQVIKWSGIELCSEWTLLVPVIQFSHCWRIGVTGLSHYAGFLQGFLCPQK